MLVSMHNKLRTVILTFSSLDSCKAYRSSALNCMNLMLEDCDNSVIILAPGNNLKINHTVQELIKLWRDDS